MRERDTSRDYYTQEDDDKIVAIMTDWVPKRKQAIADKNLHAAPIPEFVAIKVLEIATHLSRNSKWYRAANKDEMISRAVEQTLQYIHGFDPEKIGVKSGRVNFFSYVTAAVKNYFGHHTEDEALQNYFKAANYLQFSARDLEGNETHISEFIDNPDELDNSDISRDMNERVAAYDLRVKERERKAKLRRESKAAKLAQDETKPKRHNFFKGE